MAYLGDVGGVMGLLFWFGLLLIGWFQSFTSESYFLQQLYYQEQIVSNKNPTTHQLTKQSLSTSRKLKEAEKEALKQQIKYEFENKKPFNAPNLFQMILGFLCCSKEHKRFVKLHAKGKARAQRDQDLVYLL